jgi:phosphoheptose isomerase
MNMAGSHASFVAHVLRDGASLRRALADDSATIAAAGALVVTSLRAGGKLLLLGSGGSAADAQHIASELVGRFSTDRAPLPAIALTVDTSALTAIANDFGYAHVFERQLRALGRAGDVLLAISTSGRSESALLAVRAAREMGIVVVGLTGAGGSAFAAECDLAVVVPSHDTARIQECHIAVGHVFCAIVEAELCGCPLGAHPAGAEETKVVPLDELLPIREAYARQKRTVVWTNGCFDILHAGHVTSLRAARRLGDTLVVGLNDDAYVRRVKGKGRPINPIAQRAAVLSALEVVDFVVVFSEATPSDLLARLKPDVYCKGADYTPPNGAPVPEADVVRAYGGRVAFTQLLDGVSTTGIAARMAG